MDQQHNFNPNSSQDCRVDRKTIEKNRRIHMKALYSKLNSLLPHHPSREALSLPDQLEEAANYIKKLQIKVERMKQKKDCLIMGTDQTSCTPDYKNKTDTSLDRRSQKIGANSGLKSVLQIDVHEMDSALEVVLITGLDFQFMFKETLRVLLEEGADVVNASFSIVNDTIFHTIHSKVGEQYAPGYGASRISGKLKKFVYGCNSYDA